MDDFSAQSREDDDLFSDDIEPVSTSSIFEQTEESVARRGRFSGAGAVSGTRSSTTTNPTGMSRNPPARPSNQHSSRGSRGRDRGRGEARRGARGDAPNGGLASSRYASQAESAPNTSPSSNTTNTQPDNISNSSKTTNNATTSTSSDQTPQSQQSSQTIPTDPSTNTNTITGRPPAVRGDRSATGGPTHKKLTEKELTEKLEKMKILDAQKAERFRLSEADQAAFQRKEKELMKKRQEEMKNSRVMDMERAKNRERKLKAQGGREWDEGKTDADIVDRKGRSSEYVRGGHGGVIRGRGAGVGSGRYTVEGEGDEQPRGRGRGSKGSVREGKAASAPVPIVEDFPALPTPIITAEAGSKAEKGRDWAEEMATPMGEGKVDL